VTSTRSAALRAAAAILAEDGLAAATVERVAAAVGVKPASLYHHFPSRDAALVEVLSTGAEAIRRELADAVAAIPADQPLRRIEAAARAHIRAVDAHRPFTTAYVRNADHLPADLRAPLAAPRRAIDQLWRKVLAAAADAGTFPPHVDLTALHQIVLGVVTSAALGEPGGVEARASLLVDLIRAAAVGPGREPGGLVEVDADDVVGHLRLANPPVNSLAMDLVAGIDAGIETLLRSPVRAVVVSSAVAGEFCAGADLTLLRRLDPAGFDSYLRALRAAFERLAGAPFPSIAVLDGPAMGCGLELAIACTFRVATARARFAIPEITMGLSPGAGSTQRLPELVGRQVALDLVLSGRTMDATEAHVTGLVDRLEADAAAAASTWARELARAPREVLAAALRSVRAGRSEEFGSTAELREAVALFGSPVATEGVEAHAANVAARREGAPVRPAPRARRR
jgi:enoyl-CoA hydratase